MKDKFFILRMNTVHEKNPFKSRTFTFNTIKHTILLKTALNISTHVDPTSVQNLDHTWFTIPLTDCVRS